MSDSVGRQWRPKVGNGKCDGSKFHARLLHGTDGAEGEWSPGKSGTVVGGVVICIWATEGEHSVVMVVTVVIVEAVVMSRGWRGLLRRGYSENVIDRKQRYSFSASVLLHLPSALNKVQEKRGSAFH